MISLAHGQSITIMGLPEGVRYQVSEVLEQGYSVESVGSTGTISSSQDSTAAFTNTKLPISTGSLTISKKVTGEGADLTKKFVFTVNFIGSSEAYPYTGAAIGTISSGGTISLANGESITITGLPIGIQYTVTEEDYSEAGYTSTITGAEGTISADDLQTALFTNTLSSAPGKPDTPSDPDSPSNPDDNIDDGDIDEEFEDDDKEGMPQTGDDQSNDIAKIGLIFFSIALMALTAADFTMRKKYFRQRK
jgi:hypothetical protein